MTLRFVNVLMEKAFERFGNLMTQLVRFVKSCLAEGLYEKSVTSLALPNPILIRIIMATFNN